MDILVVTPHRYGILEVAERVGAEWESMGHGVEYLTPRGAAARVGPVTVGVPGIAVWWYRTLRRLSRESDHDLIWTHQPVAPLLPTTDAEFWRRVLVTFHTTERAEYQLARDGIYPRRLLPYLWFTKSLEARFYRRLASLDGGPTFTVVAPHLADEVAPLGVEGAAHVPNGVFVPDRSEYEPIRGEYGIPGEATLVFNVGSHTSQKRPVRFAETMREVVDASDGVYCVMAGTGPLYDDVSEIAGGRLIAPGFVEDEEKWRWFAEADVFASLSAYEGMPMATMEALSFGLPVVLSDVPAHRGVLEEFHVEGRLVAGSPEEVRRALIAVQAGSGAPPNLPDWSEVARDYLSSMPID